MQIEKALLAAHLQGSRRRRTEGREADLVAWYNRGWRGARVVEWDGLENRCGPFHRGFESHPLR